MRILRINLKKVLNILKKSNFKFIEKQGKELARSKEFNKTFNYFSKKFN